MGFHRILINFVHGLGYMLTAVGPTLSKSNTFPTCFSFREKIGKTCLDCAWDLDNVRKKSSL